MTKPMDNTRGLSWQHTLERLTPRDLLVLDDLDQFRLLTTRQLQRLRFAVVEGDRSGHATVGAATKATMRVMNRLREVGAVGPLEQRSGGLRAGPQGIVWQLTAKGSRIQKERSGATVPHRYSEPGAMFVSHMLGVADLAVTVTELERAGRFEIISMEAEPVNWRTYLGAHLKPVTVKPDLTLVTATRDFQDFWLVELDRATEHLPKVIAKCRTYAAYAATGAEQAEQGVFPRVLWVVPDTRRRDAIRAAIERESNLPTAYFQVCTLDDFAMAISVIETTAEDDGT